MREGANQDLFSDIRDRVNSWKHRWLISCIFPTSLSPLWRDHMVFLGTQHVNKYLLNWWFVPRSPSAPRSLLFYLCTSGKEVWYVAPFMCALTCHPATPLNSALGSGALGLKSREVQSLFTSQQGMPSCWENKTAKSWAVFFGKHAEQSKLRLLMPAAVRARHQWNPSRVQSTQQDGSLGGLVPAARSLLPTLLGAPPDGGALRHPYDLTAQKVTNHVLPFLTPHGGAIDLVLMVTGFEANQFFFLALPHSTWNLSSPTRDWAHTTHLQWKHRVLTTRLPGKSQVTLLWTQVPLGSHLLYKC